MDLISVIVPVYKVEPYLKKCVESIMNQTYRNLEIILINDGSPDKCGEICEELAKSDSRIKVIHKENGGQSEARNVGIENATGKYIAFVDSDDYIAKDMYEVLYKDLKENDADISMISVAMLRENKKEFTGTNTGKKYVYENEEVLKELLLGNNIKGYVWDKLYKKEVFDEVRFIPGVIYEDMRILVTIMSKVKRVVFYDVMKYYYIRRVNSDSRTYSQKHIDNYLDAAIERYKKVAREFPQLEIYNLFALVNTGISTFSQVIKSNTTIEVYQEKLDFLCERFQYILEHYEREVVCRLTTYKKACFYMLLNNKDLFLGFLQLEEEYRKVEKI